MLSATGPCIIHKDNKYIAIYSTGVDWIEIEGKLEHIYLLTYAISDNAIKWKPSGEIIIKPVNEFEAHCKPAIIEKDGIFHMWFSKRGSHNFRKPGDTAYKLGYAYSMDFINWTRDDSKAGIDISEDGWDSEMICYPHIIKINNKYIMFITETGLAKVALVMQKQRCNLWIIMKESSKLKSLDIADKGWRNTNEF